MARLVGVPGREQVKACFRAYNAVMRFESAALEQVVDAGDCAVVVIRVGITPHGVEVSVEHRWGYLCRVADGKVAFFQAFVEAADAFRAAGIEPAAR